MLTVENTESIFPFTEEHRALRKMVADFAAKEIAPKAKEWDDKEHFPVEVFKKLGELGVMGITVPTEYGGAGADYVSATIVLEELAKADAGVALSYGAHALLCVNNLYLNANEEQRRKYLPELCSGEALGAICITEPGSGSDAAGMRTTAVKNGDHYVLNGSKMFITNGTHAKTMVVYAKTDPALGKKGISQFIVETDSPGFSVSRKLEKMGMKSSATAEVVFEDVKVPAANVMGELNQGARAMMSHLDVERVTLNGIPIGLSRAALEKMIRYSSERKQFDQPIANFQLIQNFLAQAKTDIEAMTLMTYNAAFKLDRHQRATMEASTAKLFAARAATRICMDAVQLHGGYGYMREYEVERYARDAKLMQIGAGTDEVQVMIIARQLLAQ
jgi:isovaleryl-CoA dehydrogenase